MIVKQSNPESDWSKFQQQYHQNYEERSKHQKRNHPKTKKLIWRFVDQIKGYVQNFISFCLTMVFLIPLWIFKIVLKGLDLIQKLIRLYIWGMIKTIITLINLAYKILKFLGIQKPVHWLQNIAKRYLKKYTTISLRQDDTVQKKEKHKTRYQLINVNKLQQKIKTPNIFMSHYKQKKKQNLTKQERQNYKDRINQDLVPQRQVSGNIVQSNTKMKSPKIFNSPPQSPNKVRINLMQPNMFTSLRIEQTYNYQEPEKIDKKLKSQRVQPQKDNPQDRNKVQETSFKKKNSPEHEILMTHHHHLVQGSQQEKKQLQTEISTLRKKMTQLINDNNKDIEQLQDWIRQKSQTVFMTRHQNLQLLDQIQELQRESINKNKKFMELQKKVRHTQQKLEKQKGQKNQLNSQIQKLEQQVKVKTIQIMSLKDKIKTNFQHIQMMSTIFGDRIDVDSPTYQIMFTQMNRKSSQTSPSKVKSSKLNQILQNQPLIQVLQLRDEIPASNIQTRGSEPDINQIQVSDIQLNSLIQGQIKQNDKQINQEQITKQKNIQKPKLQNIQKPQISSNDQQSLRMNQQKQKRVQKQQKNKKQKQIQKEDKIKKQKQQKIQTQKQFSTIKPKKQLNQKQQEKVQIVNPLEQISKTQKDQKPQKKQNERKQKQQPKQEQKSNVQPQQKLKPFLQNVQKDTQVEKKIKLMQQEQKKQEQKPIFLQKKNKKNKKKHHQIL